MQTITKQTDFSKLPLLLSYSQVLACGIGEHELRHFVESGQITFVQMRPSSRRKYRKRDLAQLLGLPM